MAIITIPKANWPVHLAAMIAAAQDGDTIIVHTESMKMLGELAAERVRPEIGLTFLVETEGDQ